MPRARRWPRPPATSRRSSPSSPARLRSRLGQRIRAALESPCVRVLLTNDDGIRRRGPSGAAPGAAELDGRRAARHRSRLEPQRHRARRSPRARRSGSRRSSFDDGTTGFATEGTPVDCVRFADLGLIGERPDLIVSGINHGSNLGDDVTYSGTVAAALEGIVLGHPGDRRLAAVAAGGDGLPLRARVRLLVSAPRSAPSSSRALAERSAARRHAAQRQLPRRGSPTGSRSRASASASTTTS